MTKKDLLSVACKFLGLYVVIISINMVVGTMSAGLSSFNLFLLHRGFLKVFLQFFRFLLVLVPLCVYAAGAYLLLLKSDMVAEKLIRDTKENKLKINLEKKDLMDFAFVLVGIGSIGYSLSELARFFGVFINRLTFGHTLRGSIWPSLFGFLFLFLFGLFLIFGSKRLTDFIENIRK